MNQALQSEPVASDQVREMFSNIAGRYDLANDVLSLGIHRLWRREVVRSAQVKAPLRILDLCTGTGDLALALAAATHPESVVIGVDFVDAMIDLAEQKKTSLLELRRQLKKRNVSVTGTRHIEFHQGDALALPFSSGSFDVITVSFGIRNIPRVLDALQEMKRLLRPGGRVLILEFGAPARSLWGSLYRLYSFKIMPFIGGALTGNRAAYEYLPRTAHLFPTGEQFLKLMIEAGFSNTRFRTLTGGIAYLYIGEVKG